MINLLHIFFRAEGTRPWLVLSCLILSGALESVSWAGIMPLLSIATGEFDGDNTIATSLIREAFGRVGIPTEVGPLVAVIVSAMALKSFMLVVAMRYIGYTAAHVATSGRERLIRGLLRARWDYFTHQPVGRIANAVSTQASQTGDAYLKAGMFISYAIQTVVYGVVAALVSWQVALAALGLGLGIAFLTQPLIGYARRAARRQTEHTSRLVTYLNDALGNVRPLKAMERSAHFATLLDDKIGQLRRALRRQVLGTQVMRNLQEALIVAGLGFGFYVAFTLAEVPAAQLFFVGALMMRTVLQIASTQQQMQKGLLLEPPYVALQELVSEVEAAEEHRPGNRTAQLERAVRLEHVTFGYAGTPLLSDASLEISVGGITVVSGPSGSGKTTLTDLLLGFSEPEAGEVTVDGVSLREFEIASWRRLIGYVPQEPVLLHDSIRANVTLGDAEIDDERVWAALEAAGASAFVLPLTEQLETSVGERGGRFSGGQRQRIALARALVRKPRLMILDEMTAGLDIATERDICAKVASLSKDMAVLVITHRDAWDEFAKRRYRVEARAIRLLESRTRA